MSSGALVAGRAMAGVRREWGAAWRVAGVMGISLLMSGAAFLLLPPDHASLAAPLLANLNIAIFFVATLYFNDRQVPVFESGSLVVAATFVYACFPFLGFMAGGMKWTGDMDYRLQQYRFVPHEIVWFAWQYTMYLAAFVITYLTVRRGACVPVGRFDPIRSNTASALVIVFACILTLRWSLYFVFGINTNISHDYAELLAMIEKINRLPLMFWQVCDHVLHAELLGQIGVVILLLLQWRVRPWTRPVLIVWMLFAIVAVTVRQSARGSVVLLLLCVIVLYHRLVRPLTLKAVIAGGTAFLAGFILLGVLRLRSESVGPPGLRTALTTANEFQALFATAFDLYQRKSSGTLDVPWQIYAVDLYLEVPRQLLPFEKLDPSFWYVEVIGQKGQGIGYMFGVVAQAVVGFGWMELVIRGMLLGGLYGFLHRWYVRRALRLWPTILYTFLSIWSFFTFRATSFWCVHFIVYQFLPFLAAVKFVELAIGRVYRRPVCHV